MVVNLISPSTTSSNMSQSLLILEQKGQDYNYYISVIHLLFPSAFGDMLLVG